MKRGKEYDGEKQSSKNKRSKSFDNTGELNVNGDGIVTFKNENGDEQILENLELYKKQYGLFSKRIAELLIVYQTYVINVTKTNGMDALAPPLPTPPISKSGLTFKSHQLKCFNDIIRVKNGRAVLALPMGFGKTAVGCAIAKHYGGPILITTTRDLLGGWMEHIKEWTDLPKIISLNTGAKSIKLLEKISAEERSSIVICASMGLLINKELLSVLQSWNFKTVIVDEAHRIKNHDSQSAKAIISITDRCRCCLLVTATPILNRGSELFTFMRVLHPSVFVNYYAFSQRYFNGQRNMNTGQWKEYGVGRPLELQAILNTIISNVGKEEQDEYRRQLPNKNRILHILPEPDDAFKSSYNILRDEMKRLKEELEMETCAVNHRRLTTERYKVVFEARKMTSLAKCAPAAKYIVEDVLPKYEGTNKKIAIFCEFKNTAEKFMEELLKYGVNSVFINGEIPGDERREKLVPFRNGTAPEPIVVLSIKSTSVGLEFTPCVTCVGFLEFSFTPAIMDQAESRAHRTGSTEDINCIWMILSNSYDEETLSIVNNKERVIDKIFGEPVGKA